MNRLSNETDSEFSNRVRLAIADSLKASLSPLNAEDLSGFHSDYRRSPSYTNTIHSPLLSSPTLSPRSSVVSTSRGSNLSLDDDGSDPTNLTQPDECVRFRGRSTDENPLGSPWTVTKSEVMPDSNSKPTDFVFEHLIPQVLEILSHVPVDRVRKALAQTEGDVETAVDFLLDEDSNSPTNSCEIDSQGDAQNQVVSPSRLNTAASEFFSNPKSRQLSLVQRREQLIAHARNSFKDKGHVLT